jgi:hypothetical protein
MQSTNMKETDARRAKCECGNVATIVAAFRTSPRIMCQKCYTDKSIKFRVDEEFLVDALEVIDREQSLKPATLARLRRFVEAHS